MLKLNLLPPEEKKRLELDRLGRLLASFSVHLAIGLAIFVLILVNAYFCIRILIKAQNDLVEVRQNDEKAQHQVKVESEIKQANQQARQIYIKQAGLTILTPILEEVSKIVPSGIYLTGLSYQAAENQINLSGRANNRDRLLAFEDSLKKSPHFREIEAPLSNLIKQTDINFSFTINLPSAD